MSNSVTPVENFKTVLDLPLATEPTGAEVIEVIQDGESRQMPLSNISTDVSLLPVASQRTGDEIIEVLQEGEARQMTIDEVLGSTADLPAAGAKNGTELIEVTQDGQARKMALGEAIKFDRYDIATGTSTGVCDLSKNQVFTIANTTTGAKAVSFTNAPAGRALAVLIKITVNTGSITWPAGIVWNQDTAPELGATATLVVLYWDGAAFMGSQGATK